MFSLKLKELREDKGLSQQALAMKLNISQSTVGMWESGKREPNFETVKQIADFFKVSVDYLLCRTNTSYSNPLDEQLSGIDFALWSETQDMSDAEKQDIIDYIQFRKTKRTD